MSVSVSRRSGSTVPQWVKIRTVRGWNIWPGFGEQIFALVDGFFEPSLLDHIQTAVKDYVDGVKRDEDLFGKASGLFLHLVNVELWLRWLDWIVAIKEAASWAQLSDACTTFASECTDCKVVADRHFEKDSSSERSKSVVAL